MYAVFRYKEVNFRISTTGDGIYLLLDDQRRSVKPDSMWQHRLTRPLHVPGMYSIRFTA